MGRAKCDEVILRQLIESGNNYLHYRGSLDYWEIMKSLDSTSLNTLCLFWFVQTGKWTPFNVSYLNWAKTPSLVQLH